MHPGHPLQVHAEALQAVGKLDRDGLELDPARLLEIGVLGDLHPVYPDLPAEAGGAQAGVLPVVLDEAHVVLLVSIPIDRSEPR